MISKQDLIRQEMRKKGVKDPFRNPDSNLDSRIDSPDKHPASNSAIPDSNMDSNMDSRVDSIDSILGTDFAIKKVTWGVRLDSNLKNKVSRLVEVINATRTLKKNNGNIKPYLQEDFAEMAINNCIEYFIEQGVIKKEELE